MDQFLIANLVPILQLLAFLSGGIWIISTMKSVQDGQNLRLKSVEEELGKLRDVVVDLARQEERLNAMDQRLLAQGKRLDAQGDRITNVVSRVVSMTPEVKVRNGPPKGFEE